MGSEWRGIAVADRIEPNPIAPAPKDDALVIVVVASHGIAPPELPVVVIVSRNGHALSPDDVDPFALGQVQLNCIAVGSVLRQAFGFGWRLTAGVVAAAFGTACLWPSEAIVGNRGDRLVDDSSRHDCPSMVAAPKKA
jgi:hypothetical protein